MTDISVGLGLAIAGGSIGGGISVWALKDKLCSLRVFDWLHLTTRHGATAMMHAVRAKVERIDDKTTEEINEFLQNLRLEVEGRILPEVEWAIRVTAKEPLVSATYRNHHTWKLSEKTSSDDYFQDKIDQVKNLLVPVRHHVTDEAIERYVMKWGWRVIKATLKACRTKIAIYEDYMKTADAESKGILQGLIEKNQKYIVNFEELQLLDTISCHSENSSVIYDV